MHSFLRSCVVGSRRRLQPVAVQYFPQNDCGQRHFPITVNHHHHDSPQQHQTGVFSTAAVVYDPESEWGYMGSSAAAADVADTDEDSDDDEDYELEQNIAHLSQTPIDMSEAPGTAPQGPRHDEDDEDENDEVSHSAVWDPSNFGPRIPLHHLLKREEDEEPQNSPQQFPIKSELEGMIYKPMYNSVGLKARHSFYWLRLWTHCQPEHKHSRKDLEHQLDALLQRGIVGPQLVRAAIRLKKRAILASDYEGPTEDMFSEETMGPLTLVIPSLRNSSSSWQKRSNMKVLTTLLTFGEIPDCPINENLRELVKALAEQLDEVRHLALVSTPGLSWSGTYGLERERRSLYLEKSATQRQQEAWKLATRIVIVALGHGGRSVSKALQSVIDDINNNSNNNSPMIDRELRKTIAPPLTPYFHILGADLREFFNAGMNAVEDNEEDGNMAKASRDAWHTSRGKALDIFMDIQDRLFASIAHQKKQLASVPLVPKNRALSIPRYRALHPHLQFEAIHHASGGVVPQAPPLMVLLENLPVDVTEEDLLSWYGRCGRIRSIDICNQRNDLHMDELTKLEKEEFRKIMEGTTSFRRPSRTRTPVYAFVEFEDKEGYDKATQPSLRVFGLVIKRHNVRTILCPSLTMLFIDNQQYEVDDEGEPSSSHNSVSFAAMERKLGDLLDPFMVSALRRQFCKRNVGSCEIAFASFDLAWHAYHKLTPHFESVNFLRNPKDCLDWWTGRRDFW